jgi:RHS repeat-associated protein
VTGISYPNGQQAKFSYYGNTGDQKLQQLQNIDSVGNSISQFDYQYNPAGEITSWTQQNSGLIGSNSYRIGYDDSSELSGATLTNGADSTVYSYGYDLAGNRSNEQIGATTTTSAYNNLNQLTGQIVNGTPAATMTYDLDGEMTNNGRGQIYQWDAANRLVAIWYGSVGNSPSTTFAYNGFGKRVSIVEKDASGNVMDARNFVWAPGDVQPREERDGNNNVIKRFFAQGVQIAGVNYYFTKDHLGSIREMTDGNVSLQARYDYDLWGRQMKMAGSMDADFGYAGYYQHKATGLNFATYRAYDSNLARWINRDPIAEQGGLNLYGYVENCPTSTRDPLGLIVGVDDAVVIGAIVVVAEAAPVIEEEAPVVEADLQEVAEAGSEAAKAQYDNLVEMAKQLYPKLANLKDQLHHILPKYLGGDPNGPLCKIPAAYHQMITNAFRNLVPYGGGPISPADQQAVMNQVYSQYPLPPH